MSDIPTPVVPSREELALCAHDLRGALTVMAGYTGLLRRGELSNAERAAALDGIDAAIGRIDRLIGDVLAGRPLRPAPPSPIDLVAAVNQASADARAAFDRQIVVTAPEPVTVDGDAVALARVLENLLSNAAKYAPDGAVDISVRRDGGTAVVDVADRGPGIAEGDRSAVFEPFARFTEDHSIPGTGLGLTVVRSVAERMGGTATVLERDGGGTIVRLMLPVSAG